MIFINNNDNIELEAGTLYRVYCVDATAASLLRTTNSIFSHLLSDSGRFWTRQSECQQIKIQFQYSWFILMWNAMPCHAIPFIRQLFPFNLVLLQELRQNCRVRNQERGEEEWSFDQLKWETDLLRPPTHRIIFFICQIEGSRAGCRTCACHFFRYWIPVHLQSFIMI